MSKPKIIQNLKNKNYSIGKKNLEKIFEIFFQQIIESLLNKKSVEIRSLGTFFVKEMSEKKQARNPKTGEIIYIPKRNKIRFRASKRLKELINKYWDNFYNNCLDRHDPFEKYLNEIYKKEFCISPLKSLSLHLTNINSSYGLSPFINYKKLWDENEWIS